MLLRKLIFWLVWIPLSPIVWIMCGGGRSYNLDYVDEKVSRVREAAWEKHVTRKAEAREKLREYDRTRKF